MVYRTRKHATITIEFRKESLPFNYYNRTMNFKTEIEKKDY